MSTHEEEQERIRNVLLRIKMVKYGPVWMILSSVVLFRMLCFSFNEFYRRSSFSFSYGFSNYLKSILALVIAFLIFGSQF